MSLPVTPTALEPPPLRHDVVARSWLALRGVSQAGDQLWIIALAWTAVHVASPAAVGLVVAAGTIPRAAVLLLGGVVADRYDARRVMALANAARIAVLVVVALRVVLGPPSVLVLLLAAIAFGVSDAVHEPSAATLPRQLVRVTDLPAYAGLSQTTYRIGEMSGAALGGVVVAAWGLGGSAVLDAVTFAVLLVFILRWLAPRYPPPRTDAEPALRSVARGFAHLRTSPVTRTLVLSMAGLNLFVAPAESIGLALRSQEEGWGAGSVGLFAATIGGGAVVGSLVTIRWRPRREATAAYLWLALQGAAIVALGVGPRWSTAVGAGAIGVSAGIASVLLSALFQAVVEPSYLGRMSSLQRLGDDLLMPVATIGFGALTAAAGVTTAFAVYGGAMTLAMVVPLTNPRIRGLSLARGLS